MAVKTLKTIFREISLTLTDHKLIFVNCKSLAVMTGPNFFSTAKKFFWLVVLSSDYLLYEFKVTKFQIFLKKNIG